ARQLIEHVIEKPDAGLDVGDTRPIEVEADLDARLPGLACDRALAHDGLEASDFGRVIASRVALRHRNGAGGRERGASPRGEIRLVRGRQRALSGKRTAMKPTKFGVGQSVKRVEDIRLVSGRGNYASDAVDRAELKAVFLRSPYGHAKFRVEDIEAARAAPGVRAVYTAGDFGSLGGLPCLAPVSNADGSETPLKPYPVMSADEVQHVGDIVAMVVADTTHEARDAAEKISVTWDELPAVTDMEKAIRPGAPLVFAGAPGNVAYDTHIGDKQETDKAFAGAAQCRHQDCEFARGRQLYGAALRRRRI